MSTTSPQAEAAGQEAAWQAGLAQQLSGLTQPELQMLLMGGKKWVPNPNTVSPATGEIMHGSSGGHWETTPGLLSGILSSQDAQGRLGPDAKIRADALAQLNTGFGQAQMGSREAIGYGGLRSGEGRLSPGAVNTSVMSAATSLDRDRATALRNLEFQSAQSSLADYNQVLSLLGQGVNTSLGLSRGFSGAAGAAIGGLSTQTQAGNVLGGAASGAALGTSIYPGWGTVIGGVLGAGAGLLSSP